MYDASDPRSKLSGSKGAARAVPAEFAGAEYIKFYETEPQEVAPNNSRTWYARGQNFVLEFTEAEVGATLLCSEQRDEHAVLLPDSGASIEIDAGGGSETVAGPSVVFVPPGNSNLTVRSRGRVIRLFTARSGNLAAKCANARSYQRAHPNVAKFEPWPTPRDGYRIRAYSLDVPKGEGRFGRIFRCTSFMVNFLDPSRGPRDVTKLSPHFHDDFEQGSLALQGAFVHDIRWPWIPNMNTWRNDEHEYCGSPSLVVIPPPAIHTTRWVDPGVNQLVDIFCPPRVDFSLTPGWVLNADDYPMPELGRA